MSYRPTYAGPSAGPLVPPHDVLPATSALPEPPSDAQKFTYIRRYVWLLQVFMFFSFSCVAYSTVRFAMLEHKLSFILGFLSLSGIALAISLRVNLLSHDFDAAKHRRLVAAWAARTRDFPSVDVFLPTCGEDKRVLINTWKHVRALDYPNLTIYCLDDSPDDSMRPIAEELGFKYLRRRNRGWLKKAGNLQYGYQNSSGDFVLILDADFAPRPDFLHETLHYFESEPGLGILQTPQFFNTSKGQGWLERGACAVQEYFYRVVQVSRDYYNASICVGTCAVYRRTALDSNGGTTLIEHSEDVHTGFDLRCNGWRLRYVPVNLAAGLCPDNLSGFFRQQYRWCMGSMSLSISKKFWKAKMPLTTRVCYVSGFFYYIVTAAVVFSVPIIPLTLVIFFPRHIHPLYNLVLLPAILWMYVVMPLWHRCRFRIETFSVRATYGWAHAFAMFDMLRGKRMGWTPTGAKVRNNRVRWFRICSGLWGGGTAGLLVGGCLWQILERGYSPGRFVAIMLFASVYFTTNARIILSGVHRKSIFKRKPPASGATAAWLPDFSRAPMAEPALLPTVSLLQAPEPLDVTPPELEIVGHRRRNRIQLRELLPRFRGVGVPKVVRRYRPPLLDTRLVQWASAGRSSSRGASRDS